MGRGKQDRDSILIGGVNSKADNNQREITEATPRRCLQRGLIKPPLPRPKHDRRARFEEVIEVLLPDGAAKKMHVTTLTTGAELFNSVCDKVGVTQREFFGLLEITKVGCGWVDGMG